MAAPVASGTSRPARVGDDLTSGDEHAAHGLRRGFERKKGERGEEKGSSEFHSVP
jgi:hypothetical protein